MEKRTRFIKIAIGRFKNTMTFKITIKEVHEAVVYVGANSYEQALKKVEDEYRLVYWEDGILKDAYKNCEG